MNNNAEVEADFLERLTFRRQFLLGPRRYSPNNYWRHHKLNEQLFLSVHKDLNFYTKEKDKLKITLIGLAIDCTSPLKEEKEIVSDLLSHFDNIYSVIEASKPLSGRWILICQDADNTFIFTDPCGLRQVYFTTKKNVWCASQPTLINEVEELALTSNKSIIKLRESEHYKKRESAWVGNKTIFDNCMLLMPNHYFDFNACAQVRFFPLQLLSRSNQADRLATEAAKYLKNIMEGLNHRFDLRIGLSGGFDSRILLSATKNISDQVSFNTTTLGRLKKHHSDIYVPLNLAKRFDLNHNILDYDKIPPPWFIKLLVKNVLEARVSPILPKVKSIYVKLYALKPNTILISGSVTEIVRIRVEAFEYDPLIDRNNNANNLEPLLDLFGYNNDYVKDEVDSWLKTVDLSLIPESTAIEIFYWEQRMSTWGALHPAEVDIAAEAISPFNCRLLLETCLKVPRTLRIAPQCTFFREVIKRNWGEVLLEPINPGPKGFGLLKKTLRDNLPPMMVKQLRRLIT